MARRSICVLLLLAAVALLPCGGHAQATLARISAPAPAVVPAAAAPNRPRPIISTPGPQPRLIEAPQPATAFSHSYSVSGTTGSPAASGFSANSGGNAFTGGVSLLDTQMLYVNYADAARLEFESITESANRAAFGDDGMSYTLHMPGIRAQFGMGGGDVQTSQPSIYALTRASAIAEAGIDISDPGHRFGVRVQGRAIVNQQIIMALPVVHEINILTPEYPSIVAYWHF